MTPDEKLLVVDVESFNLCARKNLEHAAARLTLEAEKHRAAHAEHGTVGDLQLACANDNAAASIRELLQPDFGHYAREV